MEKLDIEYTEQELRQLQELFGIDHTGRLIRGQSAGEKTEFLRQLLSGSDTSSMYWAAFSVKLEDIAKHISQVGDEDAKRVLQWRLEIGK